MIGDRVEIGGESVVKKEAIIKDDASIGAFVTYRGPFRDRHWGGNWERRQDRSGRGGSGWGSHSCRCDRVSVGATGVVWTHDTAECASAS